MAKYKVVVTLPNGEVIDEGYEFDSYDEAYEYGSQVISWCNVGAETLNMSNPGDNPYNEDDFDDAEIDVYEVDE